MGNNKKLGTEFENEIVQMLHKEGYWVHFLVPHKGGQPFDIIAVKDNIAMAIECKTLEDSRRYFHISRLEDNQIMGFEAWLKAGNKMAYVAVKHRGVIHLIPYQQLKEERKVLCE